MAEEESLRRVRYFGTEDLSIGLYLERVVELVETFDPAIHIVDLLDALELYNVLHFLEMGLLPSAYDAGQRAAAVAKQPGIRAAIGRFVKTIDASTIRDRLSDVERWYYDDLLDLLGRYGAYRRLEASELLPALDMLKMHLGDLLGCQKLVDAYPNDIRSRLLSTARNAEFVVRKFLVDGDRAAVHLPKSLTRPELRALLEAYVRDKDANPNFVKLIATAPSSKETGIDAKLNLLAKRRHAEWSESFFSQESGVSILRSGFEVACVQNQVDPVVVNQQNHETDGLVTRFTYSEKWLDETLDHPSVLNNFQHLFDFANWHVILAMPSYAANLGVADRFMKVSGKSDYMKGAGFQAVDTTTLLQTQMYQRFLESRGRSLERVLEWFFVECLPKEFGAENFSFEPSDPGAPYVQRVRHLFSEMEGVVAQFSLFADNGELDRELLEISADQIRYLAIPSLLEGKYVYATDDDEARGVLFALFSDQAGMAYLREDLQADNLFSLLRENVISYGAFAEYQKRRIDRLIELDILSVVDGNVRLGVSSRMIVLRSLWFKEAANYFHLSDSAKVFADEMVDRGWARRNSTLLTVDEGRYFNYFLNSVEFTNGPRLRNKYAHGSQPVGNEDSHYSTYLVALRLMVGLVIKMNDDFCLAAKLSGLEDVE